MVKLKEIFRQNFYPEKFMDRSIKNFLNNLHVPKVVEMASSKKELILVLQYLGQFLFEIRNRIQCSLRKNASNFNLKVVFHSKNELPRLFTLKDKISKVFHFDLTYKFKCNIYDNIHGKTICYIEAKVCEYLGINWEKGKKTQKKELFFTAFYILVITLDLMILKP